MTDEAERCNNLLEVPSNAQIILDNLLDLNVVCPCW